MALVNYSSSSDSETESNAQQESRDDSRGASVPYKKKPEEPSTPLPPLPDSFYNLYASTVRSSDQADPSLHSGRQRQSPHVPGNWPTHVCIEWYPSKTESEVIASILSQINGDVPSPEDHVNSLLKSDVGVDLPLHISLSRSLALSTEQRLPFTACLKRTVDESGVRPFGLSFQGYEWAANYERNRWFLVIRFEKPRGDELNKLLEASNIVASTFDQPTLYTNYPPPSSGANSRERRQTGKVSKKRQEADGAAKDAAEARASKKALADLSSHFHVSIGWMLCQPLEETKRRTDMLTIERGVEHDLNIDALKIKVGNAVTAIQLSPKVNSINGILGA